MKKILSTVLLAVYTLLGMAAGNKANLECVYRLTYQRDTINHRSVDAMMVLTHIAAVFDEKLKDS